MHHTLSVLAVSSLDDLRWAAVLARDAAHDGHFYIAVRTTGIYCRPSCAARRPRREHVSFFETAAEAEAAGFRPCKRCKPDQMSPKASQARVIAEACRQIETAEQEPTLHQLAKAAGLSPHYFHRMFKSLVGVTPKAYATANRNKRIRNALKNSGTVTEAVYDAGFGSNGRFYATSSEVLGMTPSEFRAGAPGSEIRFTVGNCSLGAILIAASGRGVCAILFGDNPLSLRAELEGQFPGARLIEEDPDFADLAAKVIDFVEDPRSGFDLPLDIRGTAFQHRVWDALRRIPVGSTASYTEIAQAIGEPNAARAVAQACAQNRIAVAIPCHRVVRSDGSLSGYRGGVARKRALLAKESER